MAATLLLSATTWNGGAAESGAAKDLPLPWAPPPADSSELLAFLRNTSRPKLAYSTYIGWCKWPNNPHHNSISIITSTCSIPSPPPRFSEMSLTERLLVIADEDGGLNESSLFAQVEAMATQLRPHGWTTVLHDYGWQVCGDTYHVHKVSNSTPGSGCIHVDQYGRLFPSPQRYPSTKVNTSFGSWQPFIKRVHEQGIAFGLHLMQGIPKIAVLEKRPIWGSSFTADEIVAKPACQSFVPDHWAVDPTHPGTAKYFDSIVSLWAEQGLDFIYFDGILDCGHCHIGAVGAF